MPRLPLGELLRSHWRMLVVGTLACGLGIGGAYFTSTFMLSYTTTELGVDRQTMLMVLLATVFVQRAPHDDTDERRTGTGEIALPAKGER